MSSHFPKLSSARWWTAAWLAVAILSAIPTARVAYEHVATVNREARARLIVEHRLWELNPEYQGTPQTWTRFASRLLTDRQLFSRMRRKYGDRAHDMALEYRRDLTIAQAEAAARVIIVWALPLAALLAIGWAWGRWRPPPPPPPLHRPPGYEDPRYLP